MRWKASLPLPRTQPLPPLTATPLPSTRWHQTIQCRHIWPLTHRLTWWCPSSTPSWPAVFTLSSAWLSTGEEKNRDGLTSRRWESLPGIYQSTSRPSSRGSTLSRTPPSTSHSALWQESSSTFLSAFRTRQDCSTKFGVCHYNINSSCWIKIV